MLLLLDTSTRTAVAALGDDAATLLGERSYPPAEGGSARLLEGAMELLREAGADVTALSGVVLNRGPGSYTGLRVGYALGQGLAAPRGLPLVAIPSFEALASEHRQGTDTFVVCYDARSRGLAWITYQKGEAQPEVLSAKPSRSRGEGERMPLGTDRITVRVAPAAAMPGLVSRPCVVSGPGVGALMEGADGPLPEDLEIISGSERPSAGILLAMGSARLAESPDDIAALEPFYLGTIARVGKTSR